MECDKEFSKAKKQKFGKTGYNINNLIDTGKVAVNFIQTYYNALNENNIQALINNKTFRNYTTIKYNMDKIGESGIIKFLNNFSCYKIKVNNYNYIDSGSRRIDITVIGNLVNESENINFNQTFIICNQDNSWYIKNSIF